MEDPDFLGHTIFCDDIRQEVGGKFSCIGIYASKMILHKPFPFRLPKFGFVITYRQKISVPLKNVVIKVHLPGYEDTDDEGVIGAEMGLGSESLPPDSGPYVMLTTNILAVGLLLKAPGAFRVRAYREDDVLKMGALNVEYGEPAPLAQQEQG